MPGHTLGNITADTGLKLLSTDLDQAIAYGPQGNGGVGALGVLASRG